jgi:hypothetical protein
MKPLIPGQGKKFGMRNEDLKSWLGFDFRSEKEENIAEEMIRSEIKKIKERL